MSERRVRVGYRAHHVATDGLLVRVDKPTAHRVAHYRAQRRGHRRAAFRLAWWRRRCRTRNRLPGLRTRPRRHFLCRCFSNAVACRHRRLLVCAAAEVTGCPSPHVPVKRLNHRLPGLHRFSPSLRRRVPYQRLVGPELPSQYAAYTQRLMPFATFSCMPSWKHSHWRRRRCEHRHKHTLTCVVLESALAG